MEEEDEQMKQMINSLLEKIDDSDIRDAFRSYLKGGKSLANEALRTQSFSTMKSIIRFFMEHKYSNNMSIEFKSLKKLMSIYNDLDNADNFFIMSNDRGENSNIIVKEYAGTEEEIRNAILSSFPIIAARTNGVDYILFNIITKDATDKKDYTVRFERSQYSLHVFNLMEKSEEAINKYNL